MPIVNLRPNVALAKMLAKAARIGHPYRWNPKSCNFKPGNEKSKACNMSEEANKKRLEAGMRGWITQERIKRGENVVTVKRERTRLVENVRAEARDAQNFCREHALEMLNRVVELARESKKGSDIIAAASLMLDRAYGKAAQPNVNANLDSNGKPTQVTGKELDERIAECLRRVESLTAREGGQEESQEGPADLRIDDRNSGSGSVH